MEHSHAIAVKQELGSLVMPLLGFRVLRPLQGDRAMYLQAAPCLR